MKLPRLYLDLPPDFDLGPDTEWRNDDRYGNGSPPSPPLWLWVLSGLAVGVVFGLGFLAFK